MIMPDPFPQPVALTQPLLPGLDEMYAMIESLWESKQLSNNGMKVRQLEEELSRFLQAPALSVFGNGTVALQLACKVLGLSGEVITTPFTFAATLHALAWNHITPVFCDIEEESLTINPDLIEPLIRRETTALLPVHVFGNPCRVERIQALAEQYGLKVVYDAAHAFGVKLKDTPITAFGDISMFSFHATKVYHTIEGGALSFRDPGLKERADALRNFGLEEDGTVAEVGTNGKLNEVQAGVGLLLLRKVAAEIEGRKRVTALYRRFLAGIPGIGLGNDQEGVTHNYPYLVIRVDKEAYGLSRDELHEKLKAYNIMTRKYFYPLCSNFPCYKDLPSAAPERLPVANKIAETVLSLPLHGRMPGGDVEKICAIIQGLRER